MTPSEIRFAADGMLLSLARWLRLLGYDCAGGRGLSGRELLQQAVADDRVFLTRHAHLHDNLPHALLQQADIVYVVSEHLPDQLREVAAKFSLDTASFLFSRCVECNEPLRCANASEAAGVPPRVAARTNEFWRCTACGKIFWRGSHVVNSVARLRRWLSSP